MKHVADVRMRRRGLDLRIGVAVLFMLLAGIAGPGAAAAAPATDIPPPIFVGGRAVHEPAIVVDGHVLVPVRGVFETLDARVSYLPPRVVVVRKNNVVVAGLLVGSRHAVVQNRPHMLGVAPLRRGGHVYVPLRVVAEIVGATVTYVNHPRIVDIHVPAEALADTPQALPPAGPPSDIAPPLWAVGVVGVVVVAFGAECFRRLTLVLVAKRTRISR
jgi:hypothetical protein